LATYEAVASLGISRIELGGSAFVGGPALLAGWT